MPKHYYNEFDKNAAAWIRNLIHEGLIPDGDVDERSIVDIRASELRGYTSWHLFAGVAGWAYALRLAGWPDDRQILTGSCPCPPFSSAGKSKACPQCGGTNPVPHVGRTGVFVCCACDHEWDADERHLWPEMWRLIRDLRPQHVLGEQVASADGRTWLASVRASLEILRYAPWGADVCGAGVGAPHIRQRIWFAAERDAVAASRMENPELPAGARYRQLGGESLREQIATRSSGGRLADGLVLDGGDSGLLQREGNGGVADSNGGQFGGQPEFRGSECHREDTRRPQGGCSAASCGDDGDLADSAGDRWGEERPNAGGLGAGDREEGRAAGHDPSSVSDGLGLSDIDGRDQGREGAEAARYGHTSHAAGAIGGLADPDGRNASAEREQRGREFRLQPQGDLFGGSGHRGIGDNGGPVLEGSDPTNGFWGNPDWLFCRDGKWRPIESTFVQMVDGIPEVLGRMRSILQGMGGVAGTHEDSEIGNDKALQALSEGIGSQEVQREAGGQWGLSEESVLRPKLHERVDARPNQGHESGELTETIQQDCKTSLRSVRKAEGEEDLCASQGPQSAEQRLLKLDDCVRLLPPALSLAKLRSDHWTEVGVSLLLRAIYEESAVSYAPVEIEEIWASIGEEAKDRIRMGFDAARWEIVVPTALANGLPRSINDLPPELRKIAHSRGLDAKSLAAAKSYRIGSLKGYGNAIISEAAAAFIAAYMDYLKDVGRW